MMAKDEGDYWDMPSGFIDEAISLDIIVVEDDDDQQTLLRVWLESMDPPAHSVQLISRLAELPKALEQAEEAVILLDLTLPDGNGLEVIQKVLAQATRSPVILLTGSSDEQLALKAVRMGVDDYISKIHVTQDRLIRAVNYAHERRLRHRAERRLNRTEKHLVATRAVQLRLQPSEPLQLPGLEIRGTSCSAEVVCGDCYEYLRLDDDAAMIFIGDVAGHGIEAALIAAEIRASVSTLAWERRGRTNGRLRCDPAELMNDVNRLMYRRLPEDRFCSGILVTLDLASRQLVYANAGHPAGMLFSAEGLVPAGLADHLPVLGVTDDAEYRNRSMQIHQGDLLVLFSDGAVEAGLPENRAFGKANLEHLLAGHPRVSIELLLDRVRQGISDYVGASGPSDDITLVMARLT